MQKPALEPLRAQDIEGAGSALRVHDYGNESAPAMVLVHGIQDFALSLGTTSGCLTIATAVARGAVSSP